jgi:hypothetical protein
MRQISKTAAPVVALVLSVATLTFSVNALASPTTTTTLSPQTVAAGEAYVRAFLARQPIPPAARLVTSLPTPVPSSWDVEDSLAYRQYELPSTVSVESYVEAHAPADESVSGTSTTNGPNALTTHTVELTGTCASPHVTYCAVTYVSAQVNGHQELRVEAEVVWLPIVHVSMPTKGLVSVTGFATTSLVHGSSGQSTVVLSTRQAHQLATQISGLKDMSEGAQCMEDSALLYITVSQNGKVVWNAIADECPGELRITGGHLLDDRSCAFWHVVNAFFPNGTASATKSASTSICADTNNG